MEGGIPCKLLVPFLLVLCLTPTQSAKPHPGQENTKLVSEDGKFRKVFLKNQTHQYLEFRKETETWPEVPDRDSGLFPVVFNLATRADITANATCGQDGPESFCKLVNHVKRQYSDNIQCGVCDEYSADPADRHPITNAIDGSNNWWQSPSISNGRQYNRITITLDLKQIYQVAYVIVKAANSPRPGNWVLERSIDGVTYTPWQYYAQSDSDCWNLYDTKPSIGIPEFSSDEDVICTSSYSRLNPMENGEIHTSLINGRPGVEGPSQELMDFTRARYVRLRLERIRTLNADFMTFIYNDPRDLDPSVTNRYFYSIKDIWIGGQCICHGHSSFCPHDPETGELKCDCEGNTCGNTCERCCPLFNQKPWRQAQYEDSAICEECNCFNHAEACVYNETVAEHHLSLSIWGEHEGGGVCLDCQHHTMGINCEMCEDGYYRPSGVAHYREDACHMCLCDSISSTGLCVKDSSLEPEGIFAGDCICLEGYCGPRCEECAVGYTGYPYCEPCLCDPAGSLNDDLCSDACSCKPYVEGIGCELCVPGYYYLDFANPDGCSPCFCFGITDECYSSPWGTIKVNNIEGWLVTDLAGTGVVTPNMTEGGSLTIFNQQATPLNRDIYWQAPEEYRGNILTSYGGTLEYEFCYWINITEEMMREEEPYLANYDVVLEGGGMILGHSGEYFEEGGSHLVTVNLAETGWYHLEGSTSPPNTLVPREEFMTVLSGVDRLLIRAAYHMYQSSASLLSICMEMALADAEGPCLPSVEMCDCPVGYAGTSCEDCAPGYRRVENILYGGQCVPCNCYGHADYCHPFTGECLDCQHHTHGGHCEVCDPSYHGDATLGTPDSCRPCACPLELESNNFAQGCVPSPGSDTEYQCVGCQPGYMGSFCDLCSPGYYGNPLLPGNSCQPCDCRGNVDPYEVDICDRFSGHCLVCLGNSEGPHCERCVEGYFGVADNFGCRECGCNIYGSDGSMCDSITGQCTCYPDYTGRDCGQCWPGFGNVALGCPACNCDGLATSKSADCDPVTGQCVCLPGVGGLRCTKCLPGYYGYSANGCTACSCFHQGAAGAGCDDVTGQCMCRANVVGEKCDMCKMGYWGLDSGEGCQPCACNSTGSTSQDCDPTSGQCYCRSGVRGQRCDECQQGYYDFSSWGCEVCDPCDLPGHVCDPVTGACVCPARTQGERCDSCQPDAWGYDPFYGCKACECNSTGAWSTLCDPYSGQCECKRNYNGRQCNQCFYGHYDFPHCKPCHCHEDGTLVEDCDDRGHCQCDMEGQCPCKENVGGKKCRSCKNRSFSLRYNNPKGCTSCFCFGQSKDCQQAPYVWDQMIIPNKKVLISEGHVNALQPTAQGFLVIPPDVTSVVIAPEDRPRPLYLRLPNSLMGDRITSYNGMLTFSVSSQSSNGGDTVPVSTAPLVHLLGNYVLNLYYYLNGEGEGDRSTRPLTESQYDVTFREDMWYDEVGIPSTRENLMVALQTVQTMMVKVADTAQVNSIQLLDVNFDHAVPSNGNTPNAFGVEECVCPPQYTGLSCQNPAEGYYRKRPQPDTVEPIELVGVSIPCWCHGHSGSCDRETGVCSSCRDNTAGIHCQLCAPGYYGNATWGTSRDCQPCACPFLPPNSFSQACHVTVLGEMICDQCIEGYTGEKCDRCTEGYYGNPGREGGRCEPCACSSEGSLSNGCDPYTGQCACRPGITGRACEQCRPRHVLVQGQCQSCDVGCPGILMQDLDRLNATVVEFDSSAAGFVPWSRLSQADRIFSELHPKVRKISPLNLQDMKSDVRDAQRKAAKLADRVSIQNEYLKKRSEEDEADDVNIAEDARDLLDTIVNSDELLTDAVAELEEKVWGPGQPGGLGDRDGLLGRAEDFLEEIKEADFSQTSAKARQQLREDKDTLEDMERFARLHEVDTESSAKDVQDLLDKLEEKEDLTNSVMDELDETRRTNVRNKGGSYGIRRQVDELQQVEDDLDSDMKMARKANEDASSLLWNNSSANFQASMDLLRLLADKKEEMTIKTGLLEQNLPGIQDKVEEAEDHANNLERQSNGLQYLFAETRHAAKDPVKAAKAFDDIVQAITEAGEALDDANTAVRNVSDTVDGDRDGSLEEKVAAALERSRKLDEESWDLKNTGSDLQPREFHQRDVIEEVEDNNRDTRRVLDNIVKKLSNFSTTGTAQPVRAIELKAEEALAKSQTQAMKAMDLQQSMEDDLLPKVEVLHGLTVEGLTRTNAGVSAAKAEFKKLVNLTETLSKKAANLERIHAEVDVNLNELKEKIRQARQQAKSIKVSLYHEGECIRRYKPEIETGSSNTIRLHFRTNRTRDTQLLFLLHDPKSGDYLSVGLVDEKVVFSWNVGGGSAIIEHPLIIEPAHRFKDEDQWYKVEADRIGNVGKLRVKKLTDDEDAEERATFAPATHIKIDVARDTALYVGGLPDDYQLPGEVVGTRFEGCLGEVYLDGKPVGLYDFRHLEGHGCSGCSIVPVDRTPGVYQFDGYGYAQVDQAGYDPEKFGIFLHFKTVWKNSLLFFTGNEHTGDFISLEMQEGRVVFRYSFQGRSTARIHTYLDYNMNKWIRVQAQRIGLEGVLEVNGDRLTGQAEDIGTDRLNLRRSKMYFGGIPATVDTSSYSNLTTSGFVGCMKEVTKSSKGTRTVDLWSGLHAGMSSGCSQKARVVGLEGKGHIELPCPDLPQEGDISFSFRTLQSDALLMLAMGSDPYQFYSMSLHEGQVHAWFNAGTGLATIETDPTYNDGRVHSVSVLKIGGLLELYVDDEFIDSAILPEGSTVIGSMKGSYGGLYIGGLPYGLDAGGRAASLDPLKGCLSDLVINGKLLPLDSPISYYEADMGRCAVSRIFPNLTDPEPDEEFTTDVPSFTITVTLPPTPSSSSGPTVIPEFCSVEGDYDNVQDAASFGDVRHSHSEIVVHRSDVNKDFTLSVEFRTFAPRGLIFYITNEEQTEYIAVQLVDGKVDVSYAARGQSRTFASDTPLHDGGWHQLKVTKDRKTITVELDDLLPQEDQIRRKIDVIAPIYVGGLPDVYQPREGLVSASFQGCMRNFYLNADHVDLFNSKSVMGVSLCYTHVEKGIFFDGHGLAVYAEEYHIVSDFHVSFSFRTVQEDAVLLTTSSPFGEPALGLELYQGKLVFTAINSGGTFSTQSDLCEFCLCDNRWHSVTAELIKNVVTLQVDGREMKVGASEGYVRSLNTENELYIGGFPFYARPQAALHTEDYFRGCMKDLVINSTTVDWQVDVEDLYDVHVGACPLN